MSKNILIVGVVTALMSLQASASDKCSDLTERNFLAVYGEPQPLSGIANQALNKLDWKLDFSQISAEPMISGRVKGTVESVIVGLVSKSIKKGWRINLTFEKELCKVKIEVLNKNAPDTTQNLMNITSKNSVAVAPISSTIPKAMKTSLSAKNSYHAAKGRLLSDILNDWAVKNGGSAVWEHDKKITLGADAEFIGSLASAVSGLIKALGEPGKTITVHVYKNGFIQTVGAKQ